MLTSQDASELSNVTTLFFVKKVSVKQQFLLSLRIPQDDKFSSDDNERKEVLEGTRSTVVQRS